MKKIIKISIILILTIILFTINSNAASLNLSSNTNEVKTGEEVEIKITADKNIQTSTFYLEYDKEQLEFVSNETKGIQVKDYPDEGVLRVAFVNLTENGTTEFKFKFQVKQTVNDEINVKLTNLAINFVNDREVYTESNLQNSTLKVSIAAKSKLVLRPAIKYAIIAICVLVVLLIIVNIIHKKENKK